MHEWCPQYSCHCSDFILSKGVNKNGDMLLCISLSCYLKVAAKSFKICSTFALLGYMWPVTGEAAASVNNDQLSEQSAYTKVCFYFGSFQFVPRVRAFGQAIHIFICK